MQRSDSFDSIPEVEFIHDVLADESRALDHQSAISAFKVRENNGEMLPEPLLVEDKSRFVLFPIKHPDVSFVEFISSRQGTLLIQKCVY